MNTFDVSDVSEALYNALDYAADVPNAIMDSVLGKGSAARQADACDDLTLNAIMRNMAGFLHVPVLDKATIDCISILLRKEIKNLVDDKVLRARENVGAAELPTNGRLTRSRYRRSSSSRSDSPNTLIPASSWEAQNIEREGPRSWSCNSPFPQSKYGRRGRKVVEGMSEEHSLSAFDEGFNDSFPAKKSKNAYTETQFFSQRPWPPPAEHRSTRNGRLSQKPHQRRWSTESSQSGSPVFSRVQTMSLTDGSDPDRTVVKPGLKIHTATTSSSTSTRGSVPALQIVNLEEVWIRIDGTLRRQGKVNWSNGSFQSIWMDELSKKYPKQLIQYYQNALYVISKLSLAPELIDSFRKS